MSKNFKDIRKLFEEPPRVNYRGVYQRKYDIDKIREKYSNERYAFRSEDWKGYSSRYKFWCIRHNTGFSDSIKSVFSRDTAKCSICIRERNMDIIARYAAVAEELGFYLIANNWYGLTKVYLFYCLEHQQIHIARAHDVIYKKQGLKCCFYEKFYKRKCRWVYKDIEAKYLIHRLQEEDKD